ncbi:STAS domain-containing protein [Rhabdonatronobacter sediminivivens]|nr:STAS domain-containing protein [Rhabdonatronobacter sediminivivens]
MSVRPRGSSRVVSVPLPEILDLGGATRVAAQLRELRGQDVQIEAGDLQRLSGIGLEMLVAAQMQWRADGKAFSIANWSEDTIRTLTLLGADPSDLCGVS